jgi:hypothetical protein
MADVITPPNTVASLSHAVTIRANNTVIGAINEWNPRQNRTVTELYELGDGTTAGFEPGNGVPFEKVPGNVSGMEIEVRRYDIYTLRMESAFTGVVDMTMLSDQLNPIEVREQWKLPDNTVYFNLYRGCWFSNLGRTISATGDRTVNVNATLQYTRRLPGNA